MEIEFLREFMVLSETCSFQEASDKLYITNSTLSKHIQKMETELGHSLFERSTRKVALTEVGKILQEKSRQILTDYDEALLQMNKESARATNTLSVAFTSTASRYGVLDTILAFKKEHPDINIQILELQNPPQKSTFLDQQAEFIFAGDLNWVAKDIGYQTFAEEEILLLTSLEGPFAGKKSIRLCELADEQLILPDQAFLQDLFFQECSKAGFTPNVRMYTKNPQTAAKPAANHYACAIVPGACLQEYREDGTIRALSFAPEITFDVYLMYVKSKPFSTAGELFYRYVEAQTQRVPGS